MKDDMVGLLAGIILSMLGLYSIIKGKILFIKKYNGVKNRKLHSRIEGTAVLLVGAMTVIQSFIPIETAVLVSAVLLICILTLAIEIVLRVI